MFTKKEVVEKVKNKGFWAGVLTAFAGFLGGAYGAPEFFVKLIQLIGG